MGPYRRGWSGARQALRLGIRRGRGGRGGGKSERKEELIRVQCQGEALGPKAGGGLQKLELVLCPQTGLSCAGLRA